MNQANAFLTEFYDLQIKNGVISRYEYTLGTIDPRLNLSHCDQENISISFNSAPLKSARNTILIQCDNSWKILLPVQSRLFFKVVTAATALRRNQILTESDLKIVEIPQNRARYGYYKDTKNLVGLRVERNLSPGKVISPQHVRIPPLVQKGDAVVIRAKTDILEVKMPGIAMSRGGKGEQVLVRNTKSNRTIKAYVVAKGVVEVIL